MSSHASGASRSGSTLFSMEFKSSFILFSKHTRHNKFSNFLCFTSYFVHPAAVSNNFNDNGQDNI